MTRLSRGPLAATCLSLGLLGGFVATQKLVGQAPPVAPAPNAAAMPRDWMSLSPVVKRVLPAVVSIEGKAKPTAQPKKDAKPLPDALDPGFGSGVLIDATGIVLTNNHVVSETTEVEVTLHDGRKFTSRDICHDPKADLAIVKLEGGPFPFIEFGDSDAMEIGDRVLAIGAPFGLTGSVTSGIISAKSRNNLNLNLAEDFLQIDAAVNPGNSGGPLVSMEGKLIGLTAAIKTRTGGFQGVGLAVSSNLAKTVSEQLVKNGSVRRPYLGVSILALDDATASKLRVKAGGVLVSKVLANSPGAKVGITVGDVITRIAGQAITSPRDLQKMVLGLPINQVVEVHVIRDGKLFRANVTITEQPANLESLNKPALPVVPFDDLGMAVADLTPDVAVRLGFPQTTTGAVISGVTRDSLAEQSGLARSSVIVRVDKSPIASAAEFRQAVERANPEKGAVLHVIRANGEIDFVILKLQ